MHTLKAVAFDMDETLLSINLNSFIGMLALDEARLLADVARKRTFSVFSAYGRAMLDLNMGERAEDDARTNRVYFNDTFERLSGIPLSEPVILDVLEFYEREILPGKNERMVSARPREGAAEALSCAIDRGLKIVLLTNPSFSRACIECRMGWANILDAPFALVTSMENTCRVKPSARYYTEALGSIGLAPEEVLMVGNDPKRDFALPDIGLQTAYVGSGNPDRALWCGSMADFARSFSEIEELFYQKQELAG